MRFCYIIIISICILSHVGYMKNLSFDSYDINNVPSLKDECRFINLCQLIKTYYELKNDPGLFKLYNLEH